MSCNCSSGSSYDGGIYEGVCNADIPYPSVSHESVPSLIDNLVYALYGVIEKDVTSGKVVWNIPCDPSNIPATINNIPRNEGEGLLCYIIRALNLTTPSGFVTVNGVQTLTNKTLTAPIINTATINNLTATGTLALPAGSITSAMIADGTIVNADINAAAAIATSKLAPVTATGSTTARTLENRFADVVNVKDFGAVGDGVANDTVAIQAAIDSLNGAGEVFLPAGKYYLGSSLTVKANVFLRGAAHNISEDNVSHNYDNFNNVIFLNPASTINLNDGATIDGFQIINSTLNGVLPYASTAAALASIAVWSGTAITQTGSDVKVSNCFIGGFAQAFNSNSKERTKIDWVNIDCISGILINASYDIARIENVHAWPFITTHQGALSSATYYRSGSAFKTTTQADAAMFTNCFSYGYQIGFDIQTTTSCTLIGCYADSVVGSGTVGFSLTSGAELIQIIGGGTSAMSQGVYINAGAVSGGNITITSLNFWGNYAHLVSDGHLALNINGCFFRDTNGGSRTAITLNSSVTGSTNIVNNIFYLPSQAYSISSGVTLRKTRISNNVYTGAVSVANADQKVFDNTPAQLNNYFYGTNGTGVQSIGYSARGSSASPTISQANDNPMAMWGQSYDGSVFLPVSAVRSSIRGTPAAGNINGSLIFSVNRGSSSSLTDVIVINEGGNLFPATDNTYTLGTSGQRWSAVWAANGTIQTSDERTKTAIEDAPLGLEFINALRPVAYKFKVGGNKVIRQVYRDADGNEVDANSEGANPAEIITEEVAGQRVHYGLLAQEVKAAIPEGTDFGGWILTDKNDPTSEQGLRYEEFISPLIKAVKELSEKNEALEARILELESK